MNSIYRNPLARCVLFLSLFCYISTVKATTDLEDGSPLYNESFTSWKTKLDTIRVQLEIPEQPDEELSELRSQLESLRAEIDDSVATQTQSLETLKSDMEALGPLPEKDAPPEAANIKIQRENLNKQIAEIEGRIKEADLVISNVNRLLTELAETRRMQFANRVLKHGPSPVSIKLWNNALPQIAAASVTVKQAFKNILTNKKISQQLQDSAFVISIAVLIAILLAWPLRYWLLLRYEHDPNVTKPNIMQAIRATLVAGAVRAFLPTAATALIYIVILTRDLLSTTGKEIAQAIFLGLIFFIWVTAFFRASLSPTQPAWRVLPIPNKFVHGIWPFIIGLALIYSVDIVLSEIITLYGLQLEISVLHDYLIAVLVLSLLVILLLRKSIWVLKDKPDAKPIWRSFRVTLAFLLLLIIALGGFGFVALSRYVATQVLLTGGLFFLLLIVHQIGRELLEQSISTETWLGRYLCTTLQMDEESTHRFKFWTGLLYDFLLIIAGLVMALFVWGAKREDIASWLNQALFGFKIGNITISLVEIIIAALVVTTLILLTRFFQQILVNKIFPQTTIESGLRESIRIAVGYVGSIIAIIAGIAVLGLDLSNLALIVGALTVGLGFGLQNVVNNFVSGLILLAERPIKVGDWIVVGDQQGYVKNIKVRATEITTFDRASIFVPNAELISGTVMNWTHADEMGRVVLPIGVAYGSDTNKVRDTLLMIANAHPQVLAEPKASVAFRGFGDSALDFELRCYIGDVNNTISVTSDLCFAIDEKFRKENIEIPFPQQDVYIKQAPPNTNPPKEN